MSPITTRDDHTSAGSPSRRRLTDSATPSDYLLAGALIAVVGLWAFTRGEPAEDQGPHRHPPGAAGGVIVSLGDDRHHAEALIEQGGQIRLLILGTTPDQLAEVDIQPLIAFVRSGNEDVRRIELRADPQSDDATGRTSQFVGELPDEGLDRPLEVTIAPLRIADQRFRIGFAWPDQQTPHDAGFPDDDIARHADPADAASSAPLSMPAKVVDEEERTLHLEPGGAYTADDIRANGNTTPSQKYAGFRARHDANPKPGDPLCPITSTKANAECTWVIAGERYRFCCPPCIDEFVQLAKQNPDRIEPPESYVK